MEALIYIGLTGVFAYHTCNIFNQHRGLVNTLLIIVAALATIAQYGTLIWSFWHFSWWIPLITLVAQMIVGTITAPIFQSTLLGHALSAILAGVFAYLSITELLIL